MNPVRKLVDDLIEKRLWPVALMLVVAAFAVPMLIGGGDAGSDTPDPSFSPVPAGDDPATSAVELVGPPAVRSRAGAVRDPFRRAKVAVPADTSGAPVATAEKSAGSASSAGSNSSSAKSGSATTGAAKSTAKSTPKATPAVDTAAAIRAARSAYQTVVRFTRPGGTRERPLARLAVLGNPASPALQYLGVAGGGKHAIFALGPKATTNAGEPCLVAVPCRVIGLRRGEKVGVDVTGDDLVVRHYELEVLELRSLPMASVAVARAWRARVDPAGRAVLRTIKQDPATADLLGLLRYTTITGTVRLVTAP
jgi:hypothetical protein